MRRSNQVAKRVANRVRRNWRSIRPRSSKISRRSQAEQGYAQSATTLLIYLDAKRTYFDTLADYYESLAKVAETRSDLESAVGVPLEIKP